MRIFISGGCKNGKSSYAQDIAHKMRKPNTPLYYLATMIPTDKEDEDRITRHKKDREGYGFETIEIGRDIFAAMQKCDNRGTFLLDSTTALLANEMFPLEGSARPDAYKKVTADLLQLLDRINSIVIVSDYIYSDAMIYDEQTEAYRRALAHIDKKIAAACDTVIEACYGTFITHKGKHA